MPTLQGDQLMRAAVGFDPDPLSAPRFTPVRMNALVLMRLLWRDRSKLENKTQLVTMRDSPEGIDYGTPRAM